MRTPEQRQTRISSEHLARVDRLYMTVMNRTRATIGMSRAMAGYIARKRYALHVSYLRQRYGRAQFTGR